jgi:ribA/ribD-fused uncharacterized protein
MSEQKQSQRVIRFYSTKADYSCFSNFSPHPIRLKGKLWPTSEHYFQAQKLVCMRFSPYFAAFIAAHTCRCTVFMHRMK